MTFRQSCTICSLTPTGNIPAPISARRRTRLSRLRCEKKAHVARKLLLKPGMSVLDIGCGTGRDGLPAGARRTGSRCWASPCRKNSSRSPAPARRRRELTDRVRFELMGTGRFRGSSTGSCRWACSSRSARRISRPTSTR
ncbi:class I SAM-dependent methyltransferase [Novosphingobium sp. MW5]|nr:class I SAM-dependent methyltransferase [Novosphingobium sp. MW5]